MITVQEYYNEKFRKRIVNNGKYTAYFDNLLKVYDLICEEADNSGSKMAKDENVSFNLLQRLINSPFLRDGENDGSYRDFSLFMDRLSKRWDVIACNRKTIQRENVFFLTYYNDQSALEADHYTAKLFNRFTPPYKRLVSLSVLEDDQNLDFRPILHEIGHYIGFRKRQTGRLDVLRTLLCYSTFGRIYQICLNLYDRVPIEEKPRLFFDLYSSQGQLRKKYCEDLFIQLHSIYLKLDKSIQEHIDPEVKNEPRLYFAKEYSKVVSAHIDNFFKSVNIYNKVDPIEESLVAHNIYIAMLYLLNEHEKQNYPEIDMILKCIEEPTADCFMIAMCDMKFDKYVRLVLDNAYEFWTTSQNKTNNPEDFCRFIAAPHHRIRIIAISQALLENGKYSFSSLYNDNDGVCHDSYKYSCIEKACKMLDEMYEKARIARWENKADEIRLFNHLEDKNKLLEFSQNILNPQQPISDYIKTIVQEYRNELGIECRVNASSEQVCQTIKPEIKSLRDELKTFLKVSASANDGRN